MSDATAFTPRRSLRTKQLVVQPAVKKEENTKSVKKQKVTHIVAVDEQVIDLTDSPPLSPKAELISASTTESNQSDNSSETKANSSKSRKQVKAEKPEKSSQSTKASTSSSSWSSSSSGSAVSKKTKKVRSPKQTSASDSSTAVTAFKRSKKTSSLPDFSQPVQSTVDKWKSKKWIGAQMSIAGGVWNAIIDAVSATHEKLGWGSYQYFSSLI